MSTRRELLEEIFRRLDERQIPGCVQRNYAKLFDDPTSDVDLLTLPDRAAEVIAGCEAAAAATGHRLVQKTRFVNHSLVFWNGADGFVRIDVDTEKRWGRFHLLTAAQILQHRRRHSTFDVPDPRHECVIILAQALWQGKLSERYAARLRELDAEISDKQSLAEVFGEAFGTRENWLARLADPTLTAQLRRAIRRSVARQPVRAVRSLGHCLNDAARLLTRFRSPPGIALRSIGVGDADLNELRGKLAILFPLKKGTDVVGSGGHDALRKALFKGGLSTESWPASSKPGSVIRRPWRSPERSFVVVREPDGMAHFAHVQSGVMQSARQLAEGLANFICTALARSIANEPANRRGAFVVLIGLDGSGKTTLARNLAARVTSETGFTGMRYFHWLPSLRPAIEFPLPEPGSQPRHQPGARGLVASLLSAARLLKNLIRAWLGWWLQVRPLLRRGRLVLMDRYFYNYHLDPASVKFSGPAGLLTLAQKFFPRPDLVLTLHAPREVLLRRKQELSEAEIHRQVAALDALPFNAKRVARVNAMQSPDAVAADAWREITATDKRD